MTGSPARIRKPSERAWPSRSFALASAICIGAATATNLGLYAIGRATAAALRIDPGLGEPNHVIVPWDVAWKTAVPLAVGALVLALVARRFPRWTILAISAGAVPVVISIPFVLTGAHDLATGLLLAGMHTIGGLAYVVIGIIARWSSNP